MAELTVLPGPPPAHVLRYLRETAALEHASIEAINGWLRKNQGRMLAVDHQEIVSFAQRELGLPRHKVSPPLEAVLHLGLFAEDESTFKSVVADLETLKVPEDQLLAFQTLMEGIRFPNGKLLRRIWTAQTNVVPIVLDTKVVCDLRAVFQEEARGHNKEEAQKLLALVPVVIMSLDVQDESGNVTSAAVQFSAAGFAGFNRILAEAASQLERITEIGQRTSSGLK